MVVCVCCGIRRQVRAECGRASSKGHPFPSFIGTPIPFDGRGRPLSRTRDARIVHPDATGAPSLGQLLAATTRLRRLRRLLEMLDRNYLSPLCVAPGARF